MRQRQGWIGVGLALVLAAGGLAACSDDGGESTGPDPATEGPIDECDWPTWGQGPARTFAYSCETEISPSTVGELRRIWFFNADDTVTATPAVVDGSVYVGDWSGNFYAIDAEDGREQWRFAAEVHPNVYAGQIVSSAAVADIGEVRTVYFGAGNALYALRARDGEEIFRYEVGSGDDEDPTEIESSPVVVDDLVIFGTDVHNSGAGEAAGVTALDAATGDVEWFAQLAPTEGEGATGSGCGDVWSSPSVDLDRRMVFVGTGNCVTEDGWGRFAEAIVALDLDSGEVLWTYQPHEQNLDDNDFAGSPNLFEADGRALVGLGNKDAAYYAVDRETGEEVWGTQVTEPGIPRPNSNFSTGGYIGPNAVADGIVVGGTAVGGSPYLHALDAATGEIRWQQPVAGPTYAAAVAANGVVFLGGTDFTLRGYDLASGDVLWETEMMGAVSGGAAIVGDSVFAVAGIREPGATTKSENSGVYRFSLSGTPVASSSTTTTPPTTDEDGDEAAPSDQECVGSPCPLDFALTGERVGGDTGSGTVEITLDPFRLVVSAEALGDPSRWLRADSAAAAAGATSYAVFLSQGTDNPTGSLVCVLDENYDCDATEVPDPGASYDRISILAVNDTSQLPPIAEGFDRLVMTIGLEPPIAPQ